MREIEAESGRLMRFAWLGGVAIRTNWNVRGDFLGIGYVI
jgi:hypothetical protein